MSVQKNTIPQFEIRINTAYIPEESKPEQSYFFFTYKIRIKNLSGKSAKILSRHWIISNALGQIEEVKGTGVVGMQPSIGPGQYFEYESACPLNTSSGNMKGQYIAVTDTGESFSIPIPEFYLISPRALN